MEAAGIPGMLMTEKYRVSGRDRLPDRRNEAMTETMEQTAPVIPAGEEDALLQRILDIGDLMLQSGAEIGRVEDTIARIGNAYGAEMDVYVIIYSIVVTMQYPGGRVLTQTRRTRGRDDMEFDRLDRLNDLSRRCCANPMTVGELAAEIDAIRSLHKSRLPHIAGCMLAAFAFSLFFGGRPADGIAAAAFSLLFVLLQGILSRYSTNRIFYFLLVSLGVGAGIGAFCRLTGALFNEELVMIGVIMLINPGITMINAVREMIVGNTISGALRLIEATIWTIAMAAGFMLAIHITGGIV